MTLSQVLDGRAVSWGELVLQQDGRITPALAQRADAVRRNMIEAAVGGTWWGASPPATVTRRSVVFSTGDRAMTRDMLRTAIEADSAANTLLVLPRLGPIAAEARRMGVAVLDGIVDPWPLLENADRIFAPGTSEAALAAGLLDKAVICPGPGPLSITTAPDRLAAAFLLLGARYADPFTGEPTSCENFLDIVSDIRRMQRARSGVACCVGISFWKRRRVAAFLSTSRPPSFRKTAAAAVAVAARRGGAIAVWPSRAPAGLTALACEAGVPVLRMEDGFVRSVGLGADFLPPFSLVLDRTGLYYDATGPSDLETLLTETRFNAHLLDRAAALRRRLVADRVTKYNLPAGPSVVRPTGGRIILVPGQVADDRSVLLGGGGVRPGLDLLRRVRRQAPDAHILYKPHPDVEAGHRVGAVPDAEILAVADQIVRGGSMADLLGAVDEVHTLTSLTGFEALLRDKPVTTYGQPFYAGWGLTTDLNPPLRRARTLRIDELVAGTMILYPSYIDPVTLLACGPEIVLDRLRDPALRDVNWLVRARRAQGRLLEQARVWRNRSRRHSPGKQAA